MEDLVLILKASKRKTSRIKFGALQVVIVHNKEEKQALLGEFGADKDWVMTAKKSRGIDSNNVLLQKLFTDSDYGGL